MSQATFKVAPGPVDYVAAVQYPMDAFSDPELQRAVFETDFLGMPAAATGANAVVFKATVGPRVEALRCYTNIPASSQERYGALAEHVNSEGLSCVASARLFPDGIAVNGTTWPVMRMEWVAGRALDRYVDYLVEQGNHQAVSQLAEEWRALVRALDIAAFAHGDLQHGNVLIDESSRLRLVDLDGVWIPALAGLAPPSEVGHANYQHPARRSTLRWDRWVDSFSALVIYLSLKAIAADPALWNDLHDGDNLIFKAADFHTPFDTPTWRRLASVRDPGVGSMAGILQRCCLPGWVGETSLEGLVSSRQWWENTTPFVQEVRPPVTPADYPWPMTLTGRQTGGAPLPKPPPVSAEHVDVADPPAPPAPMGDSTAWWEGASPAGARAPSTETPLAPPLPQAELRRRHRRHLMVLWMVVSLLGLLGTLGHLTVAPAALVVGLMVMGYVVMSRHQH